jgi:hypothetical protein
MAASEWQAGPIVHMILARRPTEAGLRGADGNCGSDLFNCFPIKAWILRLTGPIQTTSRPGRITPDPNIGNFRPILNRIWTTKNAHQG